MYEHTLIEHVGNFSVICLAVILATAVHYAMLKRLNAGGKFIERYPRWRLLYGVVMSLIAHVIESAICCRLWDINGIGIWLSRGQFLGFDRRLSLFLFCRVHHGGVWRHCAAGALAIIGGDGSPHRLCPDYLDRFLPLHRNESNLGCRRLKASCRLSPLAR